MVKINSLSVVYILTVGLLNMGYMSNLLFIRHRERALRAAPKPKSNKYDDDDRRARVLNPLFIRHRERSLRTAPKPKSNKYDDDDRRARVLSESRLILV